MTERYWDREREADRGRRARGEGYYGGAWEDPRDRDREREYGRREDERSFLERLRDELRSWFNEEETGRPRGRDERDTGRWGPSEEPDRDWARQWGYFEGRGPRGAGRGWDDRGGYGRRQDYGGARGGWSWSGQERYGSSAYPPPYWASHDAESERAGEGTGSGGSRRSFAGRGPRGYQRSDERIREDICQAMCDNAELDASGIEIVVVSGEVTLQGTVDERRDKRLAEDLAERVSGVREVNNQLRLAPGASGQQDQPSPSQSRPGEGPRYRAA